MMTQLTNENYFSTEMSMAYMGSSQYKDFCRCEARALAIASGAYSPAPSKAMLMGSYVDAYFSNEMSQFREAHPEMVKKDGTLRSEYLQCNNIIERMESDPLYSLLMTGNHQTIKTGTIAGVPFKIKIDSLIDADICKRIASQFPDAAKALGMLDGAIVDQKVMSSMDPVWSDEEGCKVPFVEAWGYDIQGAIYQAIEGNMLPFILAVGTKQEEPDLAALHIPDDRLRDKLYEVEENAPRFQKIKEGKIKPRRCEHCEYCRMTRRLSGIVDYRSL